MDQLQCVSSGGRDLTVMSFVYFFPCSGQSEDVSGLSVAQVGSQTNKKKTKKSVPELSLASALLCLCVLSFACIWTQQEEMLAWRQLILPVTLGFLQL